MPSPAITLRDVHKRYGEITAVGGLDLDVPAGTCLGLLGPNGAGKSTTMRMLTAQTIADSGEIEVLGHRLPREAKQARARCGVVPQLNNLDFELTVRQNLAVFARLYRVPKDEREDAIPRALEMANLAGRADSVVDELSGGMRRRLLVARGLVHRPELLLLDEPTVGLDPQVRSELWALVDELRSESVTILMSTHYIEEAERLADEVAIMNEGRIVARGRPYDLVAEHVGREVMEIYGPASELLGHRQGLRHPPHRTRAGHPRRRALERRAARRLPPPGQSRGRVRGPHRPGDRVAWPRLGQSAATPLPSASPASAGSSPRPSAPSCGASSRSFAATGARPPSRRSSTRRSCSAGGHALRPEPAWGMLLVPFIGFITGFGFAAFGVTIAAVANSIDNFNYVTSSVITPLFLVAGTFFPIDALPGWASTLAQFNPLHHCVELVRDAVFGFELGPDLLHVGVLLLFAVLMWRLAIWRLRLRLID